MKTREEVLKFGLSFKNVYEERPFKDQNWQLVRVKESKKAFLWIYRSLKIFSISFTALSPRL